MGEKKQKDRRKRAGEIELGPLGKEKGKITASLKAGKMVAVLSGMELMYIFLIRGQYHCFIHKMDAEDGRRKSWPVNERNTAMLDNLYSAADALFEVRFHPDMDLLGIMATAEKGIIGYLDMTGNLPAEDMDFMDWQNGEKQAETPDNITTAKEENTATEEKETEA
jgi:hypothetical protein